MSEFFKSIVGKCFLYTLLYICFFASITFISMFILNSFDVFKWDMFWRIVIVFYSLVMTWLVSLADKD